MRCAVASIWPRPARLPAMGKRKSGKRRIGAGDVASNRNAFYRYEMLERLECGVVLQGTEVKALRTGKATLQQAYAEVRDGEAWLVGLHVPE